MQWNGVRPNPDRPAPLRSLMEILQQKAEPYVTQYGENQIPGAGQLLNSIMRTGTEMVPGVGDLLGAEDLQTAAQNNDWAGIGLGALAAIPGIPAIGRGVRGEARAARGVANTVADAVPTNQPMTEAEAALARYRAANPNDTGARVLSPGDEGYPTNAQWDEASQAYVAPVEPDYPIRAFHGSPHSFDRFSLDKIGTGEGAQAYGHGLYFAENENVARSYRDALSAVNFDRMIYADTPVNDLPPELARKLKYHFGGTTSIDDAVQMHRDSAARYLREAEGDTSNPLYLEELNALKFVEDAAQRLKLPSGSMYEVGINADPNTFLDWDRPLSEQPGIAERMGYTADDIAAYRSAMNNDASALLAALEGRGDYSPTRFATPEGLPPLSRTGAEMVGGNQLFGRADDPAKSARLLEMGINGIRYLDGNSRYNPAALPDNPISNEARQWLDIAQGDSAEALRQFNASNPIERFAGPERDEVRKVIEAAARRPTSNYVVFNDELVKILRKYGISGLSTTVGASALAEELDRRGQTQEF